MVIGDYNQFCKDFEIPLSKEDQKEVFRKKGVRAQKYVNFDTFQDILKEIFYIKDIEERILVKKKEIKLLSESNLSWSLDNKAQAQKELRDLMNGVRDTALDHVYLW